MLRRWRTAVEVATPFDEDKLGRIDDFSGKFSRHGYNMDDRALREVGGLTADMASRLLRVADLLVEDLAKVEPFVLSRLGGRLDGSTTEVALDDFGLVVRGVSSDAFHVYHQDSDSRMFRVEDGVILENVLPSVVVAMLVRD
ncbi:MAG: hypothetical protein OHK0037_39980 [Elainellaceae cyanobacterium]